MAETILTALLTSGTVVGLLVFLFKESISAKLKLEVDQRLNVQKAEIDKVRDSFQLQIQQAMLAFQLKTTKVHEVYPELYEKLVIAQGRASRLLGIKMTYTWEEFSLNDLRTMMASRKIVSGKIEQIITEISVNRASGLKEMNDYLHMIEIQQAEQELLSARNFVALKSLYMTDEITKDSFDVCDNIWSAIVDADPQHLDYKLYKATIDKVAIQMEAIKAKMRKELTHQEIN